MKKSPIDSGIIQQDQYTSMQDSDATPEIEESKQISMFGLFLLLINTTIGSGTLLIPYCFKCGVVLVLITSFGMSIIALLTLFFLVDSSIATNLKDYPSLFAYSFGKKLTWIMHTWIILCIFGTVIIYVVWCGRLMSFLVKDVLSHFILQSNTFWNFLMATLLMFPLTIFRHLGFLQSWSGVAVCFILLLIVHALYWFIKGVEEVGFQKEKIKYFEFNSQFISTFSVQSMAYDCHCNIFGALEILKNPTLPRVRGSIAIVVYSSFFLYNLFGLLTYLHLFDDLGDGAALEYYPKDNILTLITTIGVIIILILGAPMMVWPTRNCIIDMFFAPPIRDRDYRPVSNTVWITIGGGIIFFGTLFACLSTDIVFFFDLIGGLLTPGFVFALPAVFYLKSVPNKRWYMIMTAIIVIIVALAATVVCTMQVIKGR